MGTQHRILRSSGVATATLFIVAGGVLAGRAIVEAPGAASSHDDGEEYELAAVSPLPTLDVDGLLSPLPSGQPDVIDDDFLASPSPDATVDAAATGDPSAGPNDATAEPSASPDDEATAEATDEPTAEATEGFDDQGGNSGPGSPNSGSADSANSGPGSRDDDDDDSDNSGPGSRDDDDDDSAGSGSGDDD